MGGVVSVKCEMSKEGTQWWEAGRFLKREKTAPLAGLPGCVVPARALVLGAGAQCTPLTLNLYLQQSHTLAGPWGRVCIVQ